MQGNVCRMQVNAVQDGMHVPVGFGGMRMGGNGVPHSYTTSQANRRNYSAAR